MMFVVVALELIVLVGLQASGKRTFVRERFAATHDHVSKDLFRNNRDRNRRQTQLIRAALVVGRSVVVDNPNPTVEDRRAPIRLGREFGARIVGCFFESEPYESLRRNDRREGRARVPAVAVFATAKRLAPPSLEEGFDELFRVRLLASGFDVRSFGDDAAERNDSRETT